MTAPTPTPTPSKSNKLPMILFALGGLLAVAKLSSIPPAPPPSPAEAKAARARDAADVIAAIEIRAVRRALRDPASFDPISVGGNADASRLCMIYRARNGFGGMTIEAMALQGGHWRRVRHCPAYPFSYRGAASL
jgi:hypothetical protein